MRALTVREIQILGTFEAGSTEQITVVGHRTQVTLTLMTPASVPPQTVSPPNSQLKFKQVCNPRRSINPSTIWRHESPIDPTTRSPKLYTTGYVPSNTSGVTVGYGIDLGTSGTSPQAIATQLTTWGLSPAGLATLMPYLGLIGPAATAAIAQRGAPTISTTDAQTISTNALSSYAAHASSQFNELNTNIAFEQLIGNAQTALTDLAYWAWNFNSNALPAGFSTALTNSDLMTAGQLLINTNVPRLVEDGKLLQSAASSTPKPGQVVACTGP